MPVSVCRALGARYVIAVNLNADMCARGTVVPEIDEPEPPGDGELAEIEASQPVRNMRSLLRRQWFGSEKDPKEHKPGISAVLVDALSIVQDRIARSRLAGDPPDAILSPRLSGIGPFEFHRADELITLGHSAARREIEEIRHQLDLRSRLSRPAAQPATI